MNDSDLTKAGQPPVALVSALRRVLRPLVRLMLSYQIGYPYVISLLKSLYVEVAEADFSVGGKRPSDSRINLLTGVHRKDVKRLRAETHLHAAQPKSVSIGAELIGHWLGTERFMSGSGGPRALPLRSASTDHEICFDDLVEAVCKQDIRPRVILDEWLRLGVAKLDPHGRVALDTGAFTPQSGFDEKAFFFGKNIHDHISASAHNLMGQMPACFDRSVYYDKLSAESIDKLSQLAERTGMEALTAINAAALRLQQQDGQTMEQKSRNTDESKTYYRMNFGVFNYHVTYTPTVEQDQEGPTNA